MSLPQHATKTAFINTFNTIAKHKHRYQVFRDFVVVSAIALHNAVNKDETLETEYLEIMAHYSPEEMDQLSSLLAHLIELLEPEPQDILGGLYMELELGNKHTGQFFTPTHMSRLMAQIAYEGTFQNLKQPFITLSDPTCGAGGMVLAVVNEMLTHGHNPADMLWVQCIDIDRIAALMCYLQLSLWNVPAQVVVGNAPTREQREQWYTPAHYLYQWDHKLKLRQILDFVLKPDTQDTGQKENRMDAEHAAIPLNDKDVPVKLSPDGGQLDMF